MPRNIGQVAASFEGVKGERKGETSGCACSAVSCPGARARSSTSDRRAFLKRQGRVSATNMLSRCSLFARINGLSGDDTWMG